MLICFKVSRLFGLDNVGTFEQFFLKTRNLNINIDYDRKANYFHLSQILTDFHKILF